MVDRLDRAWISIRIILDKFGNTNEFEFPSRVDSLQEGRLPRSIPLMALEKPSAPPLIGVDGVKDERQQFSSKSKRKILTKI
jgi:hypothetical protein